MMLEPSCKYLKPVSPLNACNEKESSESFEFAIEFNKNKEENKYESLIDRIRMQEQYNKCQNIASKNSNSNNFLLNKIHKESLDCNVQEIWQEGWLQRNTVYMFIPNENESLFKLRSKRKQ